MSIKNSLLALSLLTLAAPLAAEDPAQPTATGDQSGAKKRDNSADRMICRTDEEIGSRLRKKKICMTAAQWRDLSFRTGQQIDKRTAEQPKPGG
jgi:hypothetical protein